MLKSRHSQKSWCLSFTHNLTTNEKQNNPDMYKKGDKVFTEG